MQPRQRVLALVCGMGFLAVAAPLAFADAFDGTYTGKRVLTKRDNPSCPADDNVSATISGGTLTFTDSALKNFTIGFDPRPDGSFGLISVNISGAVVTIHGRIVGNTLDADVVNGPCQHHWHLQKS